MTTQILQPGEIPQSTGEPPFAAAPDPATLFENRARRFEQLAAAHTQADWLRFLAALSRAQHAAADSLPNAALPGAEALETAFRHQMPPIPVGDWRRDATWQVALREIVGSVRPHAPDAARRIGDALLALPPSALESMADRLLDLAPEGETERAASPFIAAALQVYWTVMAARLPRSALARLDSKGVCPCCGSLPVASVVRVGGDQGSVSNLRYLHCTLCNTEWNLVRVSCSACDDNGQIAYHSLQGHHPAVRAETCDACHGYLKIIYQEKDPLADPVADDLATTALDVLLDEAGYERTGPNLFLLAGA
jgi:FdhE protein